MTNKPKPTAPGKSASHFQVSDLLKAEGFARCGLSTDHIAVLLDYDRETFLQMSKRDHRIFEALERGRALGTDTGAAKFFLERIASGQFAAPRQAPPTIIVHAAPNSREDDAKQIDHMAKRFERQRALIDGKVIHLDQPDGSQGTY
jgi:hypothetical protein